jgi:integrase
VFSTDGVRPISGFSKFKRDLDLEVLKRLRNLGEERRDEALLAYIAKVEDLMTRIAKAKGDVRKGLSRELNAIWWTLHDLRRTARSVMSRAGVPSDHAELCMGHVTGGVRETYDRYEYHAEKKQAYEALAAQIDRIVNPQQNVVAIRRLSEP